MACEWEILNYIDPCDGAGGVEEIYVGLHTGRRASTFPTFTVTAGEVTAITLEASAYVVPWTVEMETAMFGQSSTGERTTKSSAVNQTGTVVLGGYNAEMANAYSEMIKGRAFVIAKDNEGVYRLYFSKHGAKIQIEDSTGTAYEDMNGATLTFTSKDKDFAPVISSTLVNALLAP